MPETEAVDPSGEKDWDESLARTPGSSFFHTTAWADVLRGSYRYEPLYFVVRQGASMDALLPVMEVDSLLTGKRGVSLPFTDYCEPIATDAGQFRELFAVAIAKGKERGWRHLELRGGEAFLGSAEPSEWHYGHTLDLGKAGIDLFSDATRRNIRKAEKQGLDVTVSDASDALDEFCRLNALTRRLHGLPPQPRRFFQSVQDRILSRNKGFIVLASLRGTAIAANVYFTFGNRIIYKYGASDRAFQKLRASNLVMWEAIRWGRDRGYESLCLGRTEPGNEGLRKFKIGWGAEERILRYYRYDLRKEAFVRAPDVVRPLHKKIFGRLPIPVLNALGSVLYRHMG
ncbi:MAG: GNAT family N-acetyltransferase [Deltaproteobacteria bacterium]|nr:GNAT family N-acetyltransferase [Deltaproteobacteria bacterium]